MITKEARNNLVLGMVAGGVGIAAINQYFFLSHPDIVPMQISFFVNVLVMGLAIASISMVADT
jgi:hypothetical protein